MKWNNDHKANDLKSSPVNVTDEQLDKLGREVLQAFIADENEIHATASSPFLYRRMMAHIAQEQQKRNDGLDLWTILTRIFRPAIPALAICALLTVGAWAYQMMTGTVTPQESDEISLALSNDDVETAMLEGNLPASGSGGNGR
jgi:hypothetical protein